MADFGLAKGDDRQDLTHTGDILGTLRHMPTEAFERLLGHHPSAAPSALIQPGGK